MESPKNPTTPEQTSLPEVFAVNKKRIVAITLAVVAVVAVALIWIAVYSNGSRKADEAIAKADIAQNDSIALNLYKEAAQLGYKSGERAKLETAIRLYNDGKYEEAISYLKDASVKSDIVEAGKYALLGDCYVNLENYADALKAYDNAISEADNNPQIVPFVLVKEANVYRAQGNYEAEYKAWKEIVDNYPQYWQNMRTDIRKYMERAKAAAGK